MDAFTEIILRRWLAKQVRFCAEFSPWTHPLITMPVQFQSHASIPQPASSRRNTSTRTAGNAAEIRHIISHTVKRTNIHKDNTLPYLCAHKRRVLSRCWNVQTLMRNTCRMLKAECTSGSTCAAALFVGLPKLSRAAEGTRLWRECGTATPSPGTEIHSIWFC